MHATEGTYSKAPIIRTEHWAVLAVHSMYCRTGISTGTYNRNFGVNWSKYENMFYEKISPHDFYKMTLLGTRSAEVSEGQ